ncbi:MAG: glutaminase A [Burkholderiaceae bacterium]|nr:glutaminase A [Burkholderiaceae bacterium]MCD8516120.1 glutaminase A [Burkholderiaceae bacterium]
MKSLQKILLAILGSIVFSPSFVLAYPLSVFSDPQAQCHDRARDPYLSVVDSHIHFLPFGGPGIPFAEMIDYLDRSGVRFVNVYGIGQTLPADSRCLYYLDCPGTPVLPNSGNDIVNAKAYLESKPSRVHVTLSMSFPDLENPQTILATLKQLDNEFPDLFRWAGEVNLVKQALFNNGHQPPSPETLKQAAPFMAELRQRDMPLNIHADLGNTEQPLKYRDLINEFFSLYPDNKIVWSHMGLSKELTRIDPAQHIAVMEDFLQRYPNLMIDLSWRVVDDLYFSKPDIRAHYIDFLNRHSMRILQGTDFVGSRNKNFDVYREELEVTSRINQYLDDEAFRNIALGESYFRFAGLPYTAPPICPPKPSLQSVLDDAHAHFAGLAQGKTADYIPELASVDPELFGLAIVTNDGRVFVAGDADHVFSIQSVSKPFVAAMAIEQNGAQALNKQVGVEATGFPFNSIEALALQDDRPGNPLVNAGAIATASLLRGDSADARFASILETFNALAGEPLPVLESVYRSETATNDGNRAIAQLLVKYGRIYADPLQTLDVYTRQCSIGVTTRQLAVMGATLANRGVNPVTGYRVFDANVVPPTLAIMATAGFYNESGRWAYEVGLPAKTGVGGGIVAIVPGELAIAAFSPRLDVAGNSVRASEAIKYISQQLGLGLYGTGSR